MKKTQLLKYSETSKFLIVVGIRLTQRFTSESLWLNNKLNTIQICARTCNIWSWYHRCFVHGKSHPFQLMPFYFAGTPTLLWTQNMLFLHAFLSVSTICRGAPFSMFSPSTTLYRPSSALVVMPHSTPVEFVFDWFTSWSRPHDNDDRKKWQKLQSNWPKFVNYLTSSAVQPQSEEINWSNQLLYS